MNATSPEKSAADVARSTRAGSATGLIFEALAVAALGVILGLAANALSPRGLRLTRDYFPSAVPAAVPTQSGVPAESPSPSPSTGPVAGPAVQHSDPGKAVDIAEQLRRRGLQTVSSNEVVALFRDPQYEQGLTVFIDARDDAHYAEGHIPGGWQFHHYRAENYLPTVLPVCLTALKVVIYCSGGECEDSAFAAVVLGDAGVPRNTLFVYPGGISEWKALALPVETGVRGSGEILGAPR